MSKLNAIPLVPIVLIEQAKTPVTIIDFSSLSITAETNLSLEGDFALWSWSKPILTLCILTMPYMCHAHMSLRVTQSEMEHSTASSEEAGRLI